jgi:methionyl-tRNA formyltransferase
LRLVFMGTPAFAVNILKTLYAAKHDIALVITQPDRPRGRGHKAAFSPVKEAALSLGLEVAQPLKVREESFARRLKDLAPDVIVVVAFGQLLSPEILAIPPYGCVNLHASLLPRYRGAAPVHWAVMNGETVTGNTTMLMDKGMDTGDILLTDSLTIAEEETAGAVYDKLALSGSRLMKETLDKLSKGEITPRRQDGALATYAPKLAKELEIIDWRAGSTAIVNKIRGLCPWPGAYADTCFGRLKIHAARRAAGDNNLFPGEVAGLSEEGFLVTTGDGLIEILSVQPENGKKMSARAFWQGRTLPEGGLFL